MSNYFGGNPMQSGSPSPFGSTPQWSSPMSLNRSTGLGTSDAPRGPGMGGPLDYNPGNRYNSGFGSMASLPQMPLMDNMPQFGQPPFSYGQPMRRESDHSAARLNRSTGMGFGGGRGVLSPASSGMLPHPAMMDYQGPFRPPIVKVLPTSPEQSGGEVVNSKQAPPTVQSGTDPHESKAALRPQTSQNLMWSQQHQQNSGWPLPAQQGYGAAAPPTSMGASSWNLPMGMMNRSNPRASWSQSSLHIVPSQPYGGQGISPPTGLPQPALVQPPKVAGPLTPPPSANAMGSGPVAPQPFALPLPVGVPVVAPSAPGSSLPQAPQVGVGSFQVPFAPSGDRAPTSHSALPGAPASLGSASIVGPQPTAAPQVPLSWAPAQLGVSSPRTANLVQNSMAQPSLSGSAVLGTSSNYTRPPTPTVGRSGVLQAPTSGPPLPLGPTIALVAPSSVVNTTPVPQETCRDRMVAHPARDMGERVHIAGLGEFLIPLAVPWPAFIPMEMGDVDKRHEAATSLPCVSFTFGGARYTISADGGAGTAMLRWENVKHSRPSDPHAREDAQREAARRKGKKLEYLAGELERASLFYTAAGDSQRGRKCSVSSSPTAPKPAETRPTPDDTGDAAVDDAGLGTSPNLCTIAYSRSPQELQDRLDALEKSGRGNTLLAVLNGPGFVVHQRRFLGIRRLGQAYGVGLGGKGTPLQFAAVAGKLDNVCYLLRRGALDEFHPTLRDIAKGNGFDALTKVLQVMEEAARLQKSRRRIHHEPSESPSPAPSSADVDHLSSINLSANYPKNTGGEVTTVVEASAVALP